MIIYSYLSSEIKSATASIDSGTAKTIWDTLKVKYTIAGPALQESQWRNWTAMQYDGKEDIEAYCRKFTQVFDNARSTGLKFLNSNNNSVDKLKALTFLHSIENHFELFITLTRSEL